MAAFESWFRQDLKKPVAVRQLTGNLFSADNAANLIGVEVLDDNAPAEISGAVMGYVIRSDGATVLVQGTLEGNKCSVTLPSSCYAVIGRISIVIKLGTTTVLACTGYVYQASTDAIVDPGEVIPSIDELLAQVEACRTATANANTAATGANTAATEANTKAGLAETAAGNANTAAGKINNMTVAATTLSAGSQATVSVTEVDGHKHIEFGVPKGVSGNETIDDTAGEGDTDKVWSADKSNSEITQLKNNVIVDSASGSIASFADGADNMPVKTLTVGIEPVQDLHGQDAPYPAGGGSNIADPSKMYLFSNNTYIASNNYSTQGAFDVDENTEYSFSCLNPSGDYRIIFWDANGTEISRTQITTFTTPSGCKKISFYRSMSQAVSSVEDAKVMICKGSTAIYAPYSNICPISGWTGANVQRTGKNLVEDTLNGYNITSSGTFEQTTSFTMHIAPVKAGVQYAITTSDDYFIGGFFTDKPTPSSVTYNNSRTVELTSTFVAPINGYVVFRSAASFSSAQLELGSTASEYTPFFGETIEYEFPDAAGTVYGGTLTIHQDGTGELVVDRANVDLGSLTWTYTNTLFMTTKISGINPPATENDVPNCINEVYPAVRYSDLGSSDKAYTIIYAGSVNTGRLWLKDTSFSDADVFKTSVTGKKLVYELATPITYQLTNQQVIALLKGQNNVWADCGDVSAEYPADTKLYIDGKIAELQALILENISNS